MEDSTGIEPAILVRGISKQYQKDLKILDDLDMTVIKGTIYGLLGSSGCGKTTLLSAILGSRKIQNGAISILGKAPGVVPVKSIGYMPQENALVEEFTIKNVLQHQGWIFGMTNQQIEERHKFFEELLDLPPAHKLIKKLSGGQQRRVSLAVVLIQDPELLILDEPTVGLDPVLRQNLWDYFMKITTEEKKTIVITTHYIEEAKQADMVGLLRNGKMIAEGKPQILMDQFNCNSLEQLFVSLSAKQDELGPNISDQQQKNGLVSKFDELKILNQKRPKKPLLKRLCFMNRGHTKALMSKNFIRYVRDPSTLMIAMVFPIIQIFTIFIAVGRIPDDMKIGVVNQELGEYKNCEDYLNDNNIVGGRRMGNISCEFTGLGCKFLKQMQDVVPNHIYFESMEKAWEAVKDKKIHQILFFHHNYSKAFTAFTDLSRGGKDDPEDFSFSDINIYRDEADYALGLYVEKGMFQSYLKFAEEIAEDCHWNKRFAKLPLRFNKPIYGKPDFTYTEFLAPGIMAILGLASATAIALVTIIGEKKGGVLERTLISGVQPAEILTCYMVGLCFASVIQTATSFTMSYYVFGFDCKGNVLSALFLLYSQALAGAAIGIWLSVTSKNETEALYGAVGTSFPFFILTGFFWPIESMPTYLQYFSYTLPPTIPIQSLNNIYFRGWDITNFNVYKGFLISGGYFSLFTVLSLVAFKLERK